MTFIVISFEMIVSKPLDDSSKELFVNIFSTNIWRVIICITCNFCLFHDKKQIYLKDVE